MMVVAQKRVRRRDKRIWYLVGGIFVAMFSFSFMTQKFKDNEGVGAASLAGFDPGYIISDYQMGNYKSMNEAEIQAFLLAKGNCRDTRTYLASQYTSYSYHIKDGHFVCLAEETFGEGISYGDDAPNGDSAAHIIYRAAQDYKINPQVLIVLLQKEQSLITDSWPNNRQFRSATGYGCPDTAPCNAEYYGFKNQVRKAAALFRTVLDGGWTNYPLGNNYIQYNPNAGCGGSVVNIKNLATSALYRYTPYQPNEGALAAGYGTAYCGAYGNRNFYLYFEDWFGGITVEKSIVAPNNVKAEKGNNTITITWGAPSNAGLYDGIKYEVVLADSKRNEMKATVGGESRSYTFDVGDGRYIAASVKAITNGSSAYERITFDYAFGRAPGKPTNLKAELYNGGIKISWKKPKDDGGIGIDKYEVVIADENRNEIKMEVDGEEESAVFYGIKMAKYFATSVKAINPVGAQYSRITFSITTYSSMTEFNNAYSGFKDMPEDSISKDAVSWAVYNGITDKNEYFNGENPLTRRQAVVMLWRLAGKPEVTAYSGFKDMPEDSISKDAVSWAVYNGITDKNEYFNGENPLTRRQAVVMLWRLAGKPEVTAYSGFKDMPEDSISKDTVSWAVYNGITDKNEYFNGENPLTRRQAVVMLRRFYNSLENM